MQGHRYGFLKSLLLPILCAVYPVIFLYSHNAKIALASSMIKPLFVVIALTFIVYGLFFLFYRSALKAGLSACVFLVFFYLYRALYTRLFTLNVIQIEHYTLVPFLILCGVYAAFFLVKLNPKTLQRLRDILLLIVTGLVVVNLATALPAELQKNQSRASAKGLMKAASAASPNAKSPDIYFIIFDEYAGFDALHEYWKYDGYQSFISFLEQKQFFVAEHSHSDTTDTLHEIATRLNLKRYPPDRKDYNLLFNDIAHNRVMKILKSYGYTTVVFDGPSFLYPDKVPMEADYNLKYENTSADINLNIAGDEFSTLFFDQTMIRAFSSFYKLQKDIAADPVRQMTLYSLAKAPDLPEISTPKFVYLHVMLPHIPFIFDENGGTVNPHHRLDWNYYLGQHKYATKRAEELVNQILAHSDPKRPPVIILQSDHGARNLDSTALAYIQLQNYDEKYKTSIMNALYLPGYDYSQLKADQSPEDVFATVLNHYLNAGVAFDTTIDGK